MQEQCVELARLDVEEAIFKNNKKRLNRAEQRKKTITEFIGSVSEIMAIAELIWILMQFDMERIKKRSDFDQKLEKYRMESTICDRRFDNLKALAADTNDVNLQYYCQKILEIINPSCIQRNIHFTHEEIIKSIMGLHGIKSNIAELFKAIDITIKYPTEDLEFFKKT